MHSGASCQSDAPAAGPRWGLLRSHWPFAVVAAPALVLYLIYGFVVRLDYGPDEPLQLEYVHILAHEGRLPTPDETPVVQHGPIYFALMAVPYRLAGHPSRPLAMPAGPSRLGTFTRDDIRVRRVLRAVQSLLAIGTLLAIYAALGRLLPQRPWCHVVPLALVAATPQFAHVAGVVNNEELSYLWSAVACYFLAPLLLERAEPSRRRALGIGAWLGAGVAVKLTTLFAAPIALGLLFLRAGRARVGLLLIALCTLALIGVGCWWPLYCYLTHGQLFPYFAPVTHMESLARESLFGDPLGQAVRNCLEFWSLIGATAVSPEWAWSVRGFLRRQHALALLSIMAVGIVAPYVFAAVRRGRPGGREEPRWRIPAWSAALSAAAILVLWLGILQRAYWLDLKLVVGGRFLLNASPWFAVAFLGAEERLAALLPSARVRHIAVVVALVAIAVCAVWFLSHVAEWYGRIG